MLNINIFCILLLYLYIIRFKWVQQCREISKSCITIKIALFYSIDLVAPLFVEEFKRDPTEDDIIENFENDKENDIDEDLLIEFFRTENKNKGK